jgi:spore germination protein GerM
MSKKIIYSLVGLALVFFIGSLIIFLKSGKEVQVKNPAAVTEANERGEVKEQEFIKVKAFFLTEESRWMRPVDYEIERPGVREDLYRNYVDLLLRGKENYITPVPEGVKLRSLFYIEKTQLLVLDFTEELINNFSSGSDVELEFIYFFVDNICFNFKEVKMVKFLISGNEVRILTGHIDMENPFYPDYRYFRQEDL